MLNNETTYEQCNSGEAASDYENENFTPFHKFELFLHMGPFEVKFEANLQGIFLSDLSPIIVYPCHSLTPV